MFKKTVIGFAVLVLPVIAQAKNLEVRITQANKESVSLRYSTVEQHSSMCHLANSKLEIDLGQPSFSGHQDYKISIHAAQDLKGFCLMAFGPHSGGIQLKKGTGLPNLPLGDYALSINDEDYGTLRVTAEGAKLLD